MGETFGQLSVQLADGSLARRGFSGDSPGLPLRLLVQFTELSLHLAREELRILGDRRQAAHRHMEARNA